jgi:hypothetical protein
MTVRDAIIVAWIVSLCLTAIATAMVGQLDLGLMAVAGR